MAIIQRRQIRPEDVERVCRHLNKLEQHYGEISHRNRITLMQKLLQEKAISGLMLMRQETTATQTAEPIAIGITGFLDLDEAEALLTTPPSEPVVDLLYRREQSEETVFLRPAEIARNNAGNGLALIFLHFYLPAGDPLSVETQQALELMQSSFRLHHGGYHCRMALHPVLPENSQGRDSMLKMGFQTVGDSRYLLQFDLKQLDQTPYHPFNCLRAFSAPRLDFTPSEKDLLVLAMWGNNDAQIAKALHRSLDTVHKRWRSIFKKFEDHPDINLFPRRENVEGEGARGPEKRGVVMQFIDAHLEEIRPFSL